MDYPKNSFYAHERREISLKIKPLQQIGDLPKRLHQDVTYFLILLVFLVHFVDNGFF